MRAAASLVGCAVLVATAGPAAARPPEKFATLLQDQVDGGVLTGVAAAWVDADGVVHAAAGRLRRGEGAPAVDERTIFEIGSASKAFTALLLAEAVQRGECGLDDPAAQLLPEGATLPEHDGRAITLRHLVQHTSALPRVPINLGPSNIENPYADYTAERLYAFLRVCTLFRDPGEKYEYSNLGMGLLGHLLALRAGATYEELVRARLAGPLAMGDTSITVPPESAPRFADGHREGRPAAHWDIPTLSGAGALRSTSADLARFVCAYLGFLETPLAKAMDATQQEIRPTGNPGLGIALGWHVDEKEDARIFWHNGETGGFHSFVGFDPRRRCGVVLLANDASAVIDQLGRHFLDASTPAPPTRAAVAVPAEALAGLVGDYAFAPGVALHVTLDDGALWARLDGQAALRLYPESPTKFFYRAVDAQLTFEQDVAGRTTGVVLHQNGRDQRAARQ